MVAVLNDPEKLNYVRRRQDSDDRRRNRVELTELGAKALDRFDIAIAEAEHELLDRVSVASRRDFIELLRAIAFD